MVRICVVCGKAFESPYSNQLTCSRQCSHARSNARHREYYYRTRLVGEPNPGGACPYRPRGVVCARSGSKCSKCGWNPAVEAERMGK